MLRSLFSGVSGLAGNLVELDVIGNNIANANTVGYKSSRVTFQEILTQNIRPASRPSGSGGLGGTNPQQVGLGTVVGSIDTQFNQGNLRMTGNKLDMAIQGDGFFVLSDGVNQAYSRAGNLQFDANNTLVNGAGLKVQGIIAGADGNFIAGALGDITIDPSTVVPAQASTELTVFGNLNSASAARGSLLETSGPLLALPAGTDALTGLHSSNGGPALGLRDGDIIALQGTVGGVNIADATFEVGPDGDGGTLEDMRAWMEAELVAAGATGVSVTLGADGSLEVNNGGGTTMQNILLTAGSRVAFNSAMTFGADIIPGETASSRHALLSPAEDSDVISDLFAGTGGPLAMTYEDDGTGTMVSTLEIAGQLGPFEAITPVQFAVEEGVTTVNDLLSRLQNAFGITDPNDVSITPEGRISIQGEPGEANDIGNISISEVGNPSPELGNAFKFGVIEEAGDAEPYIMNTTVYDSLGEPHNISLEFTKQSGNNVWDWTASTGGNEEIVNGGSGTVSFDDEGRLLSFVYNDGGGNISFRPQPLGESGASMVTLTVNPGTIGGVTGLTQYDQQDQIKGIADGYTVGQLIDFDIDRQGVITGRFSNDTVRPLARLALAQFSNPGGLVRTGNNSYAISGNSGQAVVGYATEGSMGELSSGALEASNVDLSEEFSRLVVAQRSFQSNARVISTSDEVLQELVNIV